MKKLTSLFIVLIVALGALAQNSDEPQMVKPTERTYPTAEYLGKPRNFPIILKFRDGSEKRGYLKSGLLNATGIYYSREIKSKDEIFYKASEIEYMKVALPEKKGLDTLLVEPIFNLKEGATLTKANKEFNDKERGELLMIRVYDGKNIKGYISPYYERGYGMGAQAMLNTITTNIYAIKYPDKDYYIPYGRDGFATKGLLKYIFKNYLPEFPELMDMLKKGEIKAKEVQRNPTVLMYYVDKILEDRKNK